MKIRESYKPWGMIVTGFLYFVAVGMSIPALALAQTEPCNVEVTATCNSNTDCSGSLGGGINVKNTGTTAITCQMVHTGAPLQDWILLLSPGESYGWAYVPIGCGYSQDINSSGRVEAHCQVGCNPDAICEDYAEWECSATCEATASIDIKPGFCPNTISLREKGTLVVAIMGDADLDVTKIDLSSIRLSRDGVAGTVAPISWIFKETGSPFAGELCDCFRSKRDGYTDLVLNFDIQLVVNVLGLGEFTGQTLPLTMTGNMLEECDGKTFIKPFTGRDCVLIQR